ncbi:MAG: hypothetical protein GXP29_06470, partial [Planctomycetes bacterium]|nr:hypothetical protein [Planctomycetota bacterium]
MPEVETLETWLTNTMRQFPEPPCRVIEQVKSRTGIAASEFVLDGFVAGGGEAGEMPTPSAQTLLNVKAAVKRELALGATERKSHRWFRYSGAVMALATAAVIALVIIPTGWRTSPADG